MKKLTRVVGYQIRFFKCPYCEKVFTEDDAIKDRKRCYDKLMKKKERSKKDAKPW